MSALPELWEATTFGELFEIGSSKRVHKHEWQSNGVPFYRAREIKKLALEGSVDNDLFVTQELYSKYAEDYGVPVSSDLMVTAVGTLGVCYRVKNGDKFYFKDASVLWFRNAFDLDTEFFEKLFLSADIQRQVHQGGGTTVGTYTISAAKQTRALLPPLAEQRRIVAKLDQLSARTRAAKDHLAHVQTLATRAKQATLTAETVAPWNSSNANNSRLVDLLETSFDGPFGSKLKTQDYTQHGRRVVRLENIGHLSFRMDKESYVSEEKFTELSRHLLHADDVLFSSSWTAKYGSVVCPSSWTSLLSIRQTVFA